MEEKNKKKGIIMKKIIMALALMGTMFCFNQGAFADQAVGVIGVVDMSKILTNYKGAQDVSSDIRSQQQEIQKMIDDARNQVKAAKTDKEKTELEKTLTEKIQKRDNDFKSDYDKKVQALQDTIVGMVRKVAEEKKIDFIMKKDDIVVGGQDITDDVIGYLNK